MQRRYESLQLHDAIGRRYVICACREWWLFLLCVSWNGGYSCDSCGFSTARVWCECIGCLVERAASDVLFHEEWVRVLDSATW